MNDLRQCRDVAIASGDSQYPRATPYHPGERFPEYPFGDKVLVGASNEAYRLVRTVLAQLGLDGECYGGSDWNPLGVVVRPGDTVVLKPNFVRDFRETQPGHGDCLVTHGSVIRAVMDYVYIALEGKGRIVVADAPHNDADFDRLLEISGLPAIQAFYRETARFDVEVYDLRPERADKIDGVIVGHVPLTGDPRGYTCVNLGRHSAFMEVNHLCHLLYGSEYDMSELHRHQHDDVHEYLISRTVLEADCVIGLPKLKTHKKVGLTVNLKNLVGINGNKNWLPHHREGTPSQGGDQFADDGLKHVMERAVVSRFKRVFPHLGPLRQVVARPIKSVGSMVFGDTNRGTIRSGNWYGNDTTWRMVLDLNRILMYSDAEGRLHDRPVRRFFSIVDGIIAGEGNGPLDPQPKRAGLVVGGRNPIAVDAVCVTLIGFDEELLPVLHRAFREHTLPLCRFAMDDIHVVSKKKGSREMDLVELRESATDFKPHFGWVGHIEQGIAGR